MAFIEAERSQLFLRCALFGPSGSGKTMTALRMAKGISEQMTCRYAVIDTEARSASKYADRYRFVVDNLSNKTIDGYIAAMREASDAGYKVLVIDSLSHAWRELTDEVDRITQSSANRNSFTAWGKVSPKQKRLVEAILNFPGHLITTMRSKTEWVMGQNPQGKNVPEKLGLSPEQGKGIEYEFDLLVELNQQHQGMVTKDRTGKFQDDVIDKPGEQFGIDLYNWLSNGSHTAPAHLPSAQNTSNARTGKSKAEGEAVIKEIAAVITATAQDGQPYFSEAEKAEARQLISTVITDAQGVRELRDFKALLSTILTERGFPGGAQTPQMKQSA